MDNCSCCFTDTLAKCETEIKLNIILPVYASYRWVITDKFGNKNQGDLNEDYTIPVEELPAGMLTQYSGKFTLEIFEQGDAACLPVQFFVAGKYTCIEFGITGGNFEKNNLGCDTSNQGGSSANLVWAGIVSQSGTSAPVVDRVLLNNLGGTIVWAYDDVGLYLGTLVGAFPDYTNDPTADVTTGNSFFIQNQGFVNVYWGALNVVAIATADTSLNPANNILGGQVIEIYQFP